jgi:hypothetical protein
MIRATAKPTAKATAKATTERDQVVEALRKADVTEAVIQKEVFKNGYDTFEGLFDDYDPSKRPTSFPYTYFHTVISNLRQERLLRALDLKDISVQAKQAKQEAFSYFSGVYTF